MNPPAVIVTKGQPSEAELVALIAALTTAAAADDGAPPTPHDHSAWSDPTRLLHATPHPGKAAWRRSYLP
ncbi:MAG: hypothetical protein LBK59_02305 [Bifidobacteriaceae bacterium]|jgi:hypothetical protein|nr:hypothetical protein [Bifidobacteriaceae bacterium]